MAEPLNIFQRMAKVRESVAYLKKDKKVESYWAVTHDMVTRELREDFITNGIITVLRQLTGQTFDTGKTTKSGTPYTRYEGMYDLDFVNIDNPEDLVTYSIGACAEDHGDKAPGKAASYAVKTIFLKAFNIETGEGDESRKEQKPTPITELQLINLREICESKEYDADKKLASLADRVYGLKKIEDLPVAYFEDAQERLSKMANYIPKEE